MASTPTGVGRIAFGTASASGLVRVLKTLDGSTIWSNTDQTGTTNDLAVDSAGNVYAGSTDNTVKKMGAADGVTEWTFTASNDVRAVAVSLDGQYIYAADSSFNVYRINTDGTQNWVKAATYGTQAIAVDNEGNAYLGNGLSFTHARGIVAVDLDGTELWQSASIMTGGTISDIVLHQGVLYASGATVTKALAVNTADGSDVWPTNPVDNVNLNGTAALSVHEGIVYLTDSTSGGVYRIASNNGVRLDNATFPTTSGSYQGIYVAGGRMYLGDSTTIESRNKATDALIWSVTGVGTPTVVKGAPGAGPLDGRTRSNTSVDAGTIIANATLNTVDFSVTEDFLDVEVFRGDLVSFRESLSPDENAILYYPYERQNTEFLTALDGETVLARLSRTYPPGLLNLVSDIGALSAVLVDSEKVTAQDAIGYLFSVWAGLYPWFRYATVPDLRYFTDTGDYTGVAGVAYVYAYLITQDGDNRQSMREIIDDFLSPFPGTVLTLDELNRVKLVPRVGPDADAAGSPVVTLTTKDAYSVATGQEATPRANRCTVSVQPLTQEDDIEIMKAQWFHAKADTFPVGDVLTVPGGSTDITDPVGRGDGQYPATLWEAEDDKFADFIEFEDSGSVLQLDADMKYSRTSLTSYTTINQASSSLVIENLSQVQLSTEAGWQNAFQVRYPTFYGSDLTWTFQLRWQDAPKRGFEIRLSFERSTAYIADSFGFPRLNHADCGVTLASSATAWTKSATRTTGTFGYSTDDTLPSETGGNLVTESQGLYGDITRQINIVNYDLDAVTLLEIAKGIVVDGVEPKTITEVEQSVWRAFPVRNKHLGRLVELPDTTEGVVVNRTYQDDMGQDYSPGSMSSLFQVEVTTAQIDTTTDFLLLDDGELMLLDDGTIAEAN